MPRSLHRLGERQIKVGFPHCALLQRPPLRTPVSTAFPAHPATKPPSLHLSLKSNRSGAMLRILLVSGLLAVLSPWGASQEASPSEEPALPWTVVTLNESCKDQVLQHVSAIILPLLRLDHPPRFTADATSQVRESWAKEVAAFPSLSSRGQHLNISSNQTLLRQSGSCIQISHHITLEDLGWQSWVLHPKAFVFTECLGCHCHQKDGGPPLWIKECHLRDPGTQADLDAQERRCCRPRRTPLAFAFLKEDGSLVLRPLRLVGDCNC